MSHILAKMQWPWPRLSRLIFHSSLVLPDLGGHFTNDKFNGEFLFLQLNHCPRLLQFFYMSQQYRCCGMCKISQWPLYYSMDKNKLKFPPVWIVVENQKWNGLCHSLLLWQVIRAGSKHWLDKAFQHQSPVPSLAYKYIWACKSK